MIGAGVFSRVYKGEILKQEFKEGLGEIQRVLKVLEETQRVLKKTQIVLEEIQGGLNKVKGMLQRRDFKGELKEGLGEHLIN